MDESVIKNILVELKDIGVKAIEFSGGGEPLTHPSAREIMKFTAELGFDIGLVTNGLLLNKILDISNLFKFIRISLDAATKEVYYRTHGVNTFNTVIDNIYKATNYFSGNNIGIGYLITGINNEDILDATILAKKLGVRFIQYRPASLEYSVNENIWLEAKQLVDKALAFSDEKFQVFGAGIKWGHINERRYYYKCYTNSLVSVIKANGDVPMCVLKRNNMDSILGNIYSSSFSNIFFSKKHYNLIENNDLLKCRKPCKHDSYNIMYECYMQDLLHMNFI